MVVWLMPYFSFTMQEAESRTTWLLAPGSVKEEGGKEGEGEERERGEGGREGGGGREGDQRPWQC